MAMIRKHIEFGEGLVILHVNRSPENVSRDTQKAAIKRTTTTNQPNGNFNAHEKCCTMDFELTYYSKLWLAQLSLPFAEYNKFRKINKQKQTASQLADACTG